MDSGWNWSPNTLRPASSTDMTSPSSATDVILRSAGRVVLSTASEWYLPTVVLKPRPLNISESPSSASEVFPCISLEAYPTLAPYASQMA